jgi:hypothetical protein
LPKADIAHLIRRNPPNRRLHASLSNTDRRHQPALAPAAFAAAPVQEFTLANGLKVLVREDHRAPVVVSQIWYKVGSSYEPSGLTGISTCLNT